MNPRANVQYSTCHTVVSKGTRFSSEDPKKNFGVDISVMLQEYSPVARAKRCVFWSSRWFGSQILKDIQRTNSMPAAWIANESIRTTSDSTLQNILRAWFSEFLLVPIFQSIPILCNSFREFHKVSQGVSSCFSILVLKSSVFPRPCNSWISPDAWLFASAKRRDTQTSKLGEKNEIDFNHWVGWHEFTSMMLSMSQWCHLIIHPHVDKPIDFNVWHSFTLLLVWTNSVPRRVWFLSGNRSATPSTRRLGRRWKHAAVLATYCLTKLTKLNQTFGTLWPSLSSFWTWTNDDRWWYIAWHMIFVQTKIRTQAYHNL